MLEILTKQFVENLGTITAFTALLIGTLGLIISWLSYKKYKAQQQLIEFIGQQGDDLDEMISKNRAMLEKEVQINVEQSRRIAWLESRIRQPKQPVKEEPQVEEAPQPKFERTNITERRHRVLALYAKGQSTETIATTLGMMPGEVELMVKLNQTPSFI